MSLENPGPAAMCMNLCQRAAASGRALFLLSYVPLLITRRLMLTFPSVWTITFWLKRFHPVIRTATGCRILPLGVKTDFTQVPGRMIAVVFFTKLSSSHWKAVQLLKNFESSNSCMWTTCSRREAAVREQEFGPDSHFHQLSCARNRNL